MKEIDWIRYKGWNAHRSFGLRKEWVALWMDRPEDWVSFGHLGNRQVQSLHTWLKTAGIVDRKGEKTPLGLKFQTESADSLGAWELAWVNIVFNFPPARWYVFHFPKGAWSIQELKMRLRQSLPHFSTRTVSNSIMELVGLLERTPIGKELQQGEVTREGRDRKIKREGLQYPMVSSIKFAFHRLFAEERRDRLYFDDHLLFPWIIFGTEQQEVFKQLILAGEGEIEIDDMGVILHEDNYERGDNVVL